MTKAGFMDSYADLVMELELSLYPVYRMSGIDKLVQTSERKLGRLDFFSRLDVSTAYALSAGFAAWGMSDRLILVASAATAAIGVLHHKAMAENFRSYTRDEETLDITRDNL